MTILVTGGGGGIGSSFVLDWLATADEPVINFLYKTTDYYAPECERSLLWNDITLRIKWPIDSHPKLAAKAPPR